MVKFFYRLTILIAFFYVSCNNEEVNRIGEQRMLNNIHSLYNDSIWIGLPMKINENKCVIQTYYPAVLEANLNYYGIFILDEVEEKQITPLMDFTLENSKALFKLKDYEEINKNDDIYMFNLKSSNKKLNDSIGCVFPNFDEKYSPVKGLVNYSSWGVVIFDTKFGTYIEKELLSSSKSSNTHGVSKGYFINSKADSVIYWLIGW